jgi:L-ascorbate metabolism protein UlaG (beta-lactamase superfamily)
MFTRLMIHAMVFGVLFGLFLFWSGPSAAGGGSGAASQLSAGVARMADCIHWLGHDSMRIEADGVVIYIDPWQISGESKKADLVLITHDHMDHCSPEDVERVSKEGTEIVTISAAAEKLPGKPVHVVAPGDKLTVKGIPIEATAAYNIKKFRSPGVPFHPKESRHVGFVITLDGVRVYHAGDTDCIPEMSEVRADIALLPVSGTYVMTAEEAVEAVKILGPALAIPMHVGRGIGSLEDATRFKELSPVLVRVLSME